MWVAKDRSHVCNVNICSHHIVALLAVLAHDGLIDKLLINNRMFSFYVFVRTQGHTDSEEPPIVKNGST